jgi:hypothetical protein
MHNATNNDAASSLKSHRIIEFLGWPTEQGGQRLSLLMTNMIMESDRKALPARQVAWQATSSECDYAATTVMDSITVSKSPKNDLVNALRHARMW